MARQFFHCLIFMCKASAYYSGGFAVLHSIEDLPTKRLGSKYQSDKNALACQAVAFMTGKKGFIVQAPG